MPRSHVPRDQATTAFTEILAQVCRDTGSSVAALVDTQGETVDYHSESLSGFDVRVMAAEWQLVLATMHDSQKPARLAASWFLVRASRRSFAIIALGSGYGLILELTPRSFLVSERALAASTRALCRESGLEPPGAFRARERWVRVQVQTVPTDRRRPLSVWHGDQWVPIVVLGRYQRLDRAGREQGFRARLESGAEFSLVREPLGVWFAENLD